MLEVLAALSLSAAMGMRIALPLLLIGLFRSDDLWANLPVLSKIPPQIVIGVLVSWSLIELLFSKHRLFQRLLQITQLWFSPFLGALAGLTVARTAHLDGTLVWILAAIGGALALVFQLVQVGWAYRLQNGLPVWGIVIQDFLCVLLVMLAFDAPRQGGLIVLLLLWIAIRSSGNWRLWYQQQTSRRQKNPRRFKDDPD